MIDPNFSGHWKGAYVYGEPYTNSIKGTKIAFEMELTVTDGKVTGTCVDDETKTFFDTPSSIEGVINNTTIHFVKRYPCFFSYAEGSELVLFPKLPSHEIHYSGLFENGQFSGSWEFKISYDLDAAGEMDYIGKGEWYMTRADTT